MLPAIPIRFRRGERKFSEMTRFKKTNKSGDETSTERRARLIFESEGRKGVTWNLIAPEDRKPGAVPRIVLSEAAKERYRQLAKKEPDL